MSALMIIGIVTAALVVTVVCVFVLRKKIKEFGIELTTLEARYMAGSSAHATEFKAEIERYRSIGKMADRADAKIKLLKPLVPGEHFIDATAVDIIKSVCQVIDNKSPFFAGSEQVFMMFIPPDQLADGVALLAEEITKHCTQATAESILASKEAFLEGLHNIQDPEVIAECLKNFLGEVLKNLVNPENLEALEAVYLSSGVPGVLVTVIGPEAIFKGLDPAFHFKDYLQDLGTILKDHSIAVGDDFGDYLDGGFEPDFVPHFPYFTVIFSTIREIKLLSSKKTNLVNSIKNAGLDAVGTTAGGFGGALVLAPLLDVVFFGAATLATIIGTGLGAFLGRKATNKIKHLDLNYAISDFNSCVSNMEYSLKIVANEAFASVKETAQNKHNEFLEKVGRAPGTETSQSRIIMMGDRMKYDLQMPINSFKAQLNALKQRWISHLPKFSKIIISMEQKILEMEQRLLRSYPDPMDRVGAFTTGRFIYTENCEALIASELNALRKINREAYRDVLMWSINASGEYQLACFSVVEKIQVHIKKFKDEFNGWETKLDSKKRKIDEEKGKLGY